MWKTAGLSLMALVSLTLLPVAAVAQHGRWGLSADVALTRFWGGSHPVGSATPADATPARPYRPTSVGIRLDRELGGARVAVGLRYAGAGLGIEGSDLSVVAKGVFDWVEVAPELGVRIASAQGNSVFVFGGPVVDLWKPRDTTTRTRLGGRAGLELNVPFSSRVSALVRASAAVTGSIFEPDEVPPGFERGAMSRCSVGLGLRLGL